MRIETSGAQQQQQQEEEEYQQQLQIIELFGVAVVEIQINGY
jgi:hypothetical protein